MKDGKHLIPPPFSSRRRELNPAHFIHLFFINKMLHAQPQSHRYGTLSLRRGQGEVIFPNFVIINNAPAWPILERHIL